MSLSKFTGAAVLLAALAPSVAAVGTATVVNNCGFPIYYASVGQSQHAEMKEMQGSYSEQYGQQGNGISIKLAPSADGHVSQFEFTLDGGSIYYDLSNIDGYPFADGGMRVVPSISDDSSNPTCVPIDCPAGDSYCHAAYNLPDDVRTHVCDQSADLVLTMCPNGSSGTPTESGSGSETSATDATTESTTESTESAAPEASSTGSWGQPPAKRAEHGHQRAHSRAFRV